MNTNKWITAMICIMILIVALIYGTTKTTKYFVTAVVVKVGNEDGFTFDKFHTPTQYHTLLLRDTKDSTKFCELSISPERYYNTHINDTIIINYKVNKAEGTHCTYFKNTTASYVDNGDYSDISNYYNWIHINRK